MNKENLLKLADFLDGVKGSNFRMETYRSGGVLDDLDSTDLRMGKEEIEKCGTSCCALGWAPCVPGLEVEPSDWDDDGGYDSFSWSKYGLRVFGLRDNTYDDPEDEWNWCFRGEWENKDNTPKGAAARIRHLVVYGLPGDWWDQMSGRARLCYKEAK